LAQFRLEPLGFSTKRKIVIELEAID